MMDELIKEQNDFMDIVLLIKKLNKKTNIKRKFNQDKKNILYSHNNESFATFSKN